MCVVWRNKKETDIEIINNNNIKLQQNQKRIAKKYGKYEEKILSTESSQLHNSPLSCFFLLLNVLLFFPPSSVSFLNVRNIWSVRDRIIFRNFDSHRFRSRGLFVFFLRDFFSLFTPYQGCKRFFFRITRRVCVSRVEGEQKSNQIIPRLFKKKSNVHPSLFQTRNKSILFGEVLFLNLVNLFFTPSP